MFQRKRHYWRLDSKCITLFQNDTGSKYYKVRGALVILITDVYGNMLKENSSVFEVFANCLKMFSCCVKLLNASIRYLCSCQQSLKLLKSEKMSITHLKLKFTNYFILSAGDPSVRDLISGAGSNLLSASRWSQPSLLWDRYSLSGLLHRRAPAESWIICDRQQRSGE